jgi:hypothetical protein
VTWHPLLSTPQFFFLLSSSHISILYPTFNGTNRAGRVSLTFLKKSDRAGSDHGRFESGQFIYCVFSNL